jgi:GGDEF domain-containing protein
VVTDSALGAPIAVLAQQLPPTTPLILFVDNEAEAVFARSAGATAALIVPADLADLDVQLLLQLPPLEKDVASTGDSLTPLLMSGTFIPESTAPLDAVSFVARLQSVCEQAERTGTSIFLIELTFDERTTLHHLDEEARSDTQRVLGQLIGDERRMGALVGKIGDERWMLVLAQSAPAQAYHLAQQICATVAAFDWSIVANGLQITLNNTVHEYAPDTTANLPAYVHNALAD